MTRDELDKYLARLESWQEAIGFEPIKHTYTFNGNPLPSVSELMRPLSTMVYGGETSRFAKDAMDRGRRAHGAMEALDSIGVYPIEYDTMNYVNAYIAWRESRPDLEIICNEKRVKGNWYCGTIDKLAYDEKYGRIHLIDIKTGDTAHSRLWSVQMEFYARALEAMGLYTSSSFVVQCKSTGGYEEFEYVGYPDMIDTLKRVHSYMKRGNPDEVYYV